MRINDDGTPEWERDLERHLTVFFVSVWSLLLVCFSVAGGSVADRVAPEGWLLGALLGFSAGRSVLLATMRPVMLSLGGVYLAVWSRWRRRHG